MAEAAEKRVDPGAGAEEPRPEPRVARFEQLAFGMFVHFGLYSILGRGEWVREIEKIPADEYEPLAGRFEPGNMRQIVKVAKAAGCSYVTLTTRHHDGFSLYDAGEANENVCDAFDAVRSAAGRDLVAEFVDACRGEGLLPFFYHTTLDWHRREFREDFPAYLRYLERSVEILCRNYGPVGGFWFDGNWSRNDVDWQEERLYKLIRRLQPEAMIINNTGLEARGKLGCEEIDAVTFERGRPDPMDRRGQPKYVAAEMCETLCDHWGKAALDVNFKSVGLLIEELCECRKVGANFLLNVGPDGDGSVDGMQRATMECIGRWMSVYGRAIRNGRPFLRYPDRREFLLRDAFDDNVAYLFKFDPSKYVEPGPVAPDANRLVLGRIPGKVASIRWMDGKEAAFEQRGNELAVELTPFPYGTSFPVRVAEVVFE
jgi:alpha-L-fucosidase